MTYSLWSSSFRHCTLLIQQNEILNFFFQIHYIALQAFQESLLTTTESPPKTTQLSGKKKKKKTIILTFILCCFETVGRDDSDGSGIESRWGQDFPHTSRLALGPTQPPTQRIPGLFRGVKRPGHGVDHPTHLAPK
jgi:hypothetical protein